MSHPLKGKPRREYPANVIRFAQRLHDENGYTLAEVLSSLSSRGYHPTREMVRRWLDPEYHAAVNAARRTGGVPRTRTKPWTYRLARMQELRKAGVTYASIARVMNLDFGLSLDRGQAERITKGSAKNIRRFVYPEGT